MKTYRNVELQFLVDFEKPVSKHLAKVLLRMAQDMLSDKKTEVRQLHTEHGCFIRIKTKFERLSESDITGYYFSAELDFFTQRTTGYVITAHLNPLLVHFTELEGTRDDRVVEAYFGEYKRFRGEKAYLHMISRRGKLYKITADKIMLQAHGIRPKRWFTLELVKEGDGVTTRWTSLTGEALKQAVWEHLVMQTQFPTQLN